MRLWYSKPSPFTRKVLVVAHEAGVIDRIERISVDTVTGDELLNAENPLGKIPCLVTDDGMMRLFDSRVICEYLDTVLNASRLHPPASAARWQALRRQALADGIMEAAVLCRYETLRPVEQRAPEWVGKQQGKIARALDALSDDLQTGPLTIGDVATACALGYLDLRFPELRWRDGRDRLALWFDAFSQRPSMIATAPD